MKKTGIAICIMMLMFSLTACAGEAGEKDDKKQKDIAEAVAEAMEDAEADAKDDKQAKEEALEEEESSGDKQVEITVETKTYEKSMYLDEEILLFDLRWDRPVLSGSGVSGLDAINEAFEKEMEETIAVLTQEEMDEENYSTLYAYAKQDYHDRVEMAEEMGEELFFNPYSFQMAYSLQRADDKVISFTSSESSYLGGAHGSNLISGINYDPETGKLLTLEDVCVDKEAFLQISQEEIVRQIEAIRVRDPYMFFEDYQNYVSDVFQEGCWYLKDSGVSWISRQYTLQPYAAGTIEFLIPYDMLEGCMDSVYFTSKEVQEISAVKEGVTNILTDVVDWTGLTFVYSQEAKEMELTPEAVAGMMGQVISATGSENSYNDTENYSCIIPIGDLITEAEAYFQEDILTDATLDGKKLEETGVYLDEEGNLVVGYGDWGLAVPRFRISEAEKIGEEEYRITAEYFMYDYETYLDGEVQAVAEYEIVKSEKGRYGYLIKDMKLTVK